MSVAASPPALQELGGYIITRELRPDYSYLAIAPGGRKVVLKILDSDVLLGDQLHPNIRDRLGRVSELAHRGVANLHGVERDQGKIYAIWEYIEGTTLRDFAISERTTRRQLLAATRELLLTLQTLHALGIVHGAIHGRNVIIDENGIAKLTHVSPLLHYDPAVDEAATLAMLRDIESKRDTRGFALSSATSLRELAASLASELDSADSTRVVHEQVTENTSSRVRAIAAAIIIALLGAAVSAGSYWLVKKSQPRLPQPLRAPSSTIERADS